VQVDGRTGTVVFDLRPRWNYIKVKWSDTQSLSEVIRADRANSTKVSGHLSRSHPILTVSTLVPLCHMADSLHATKIGMSESVCVTIDG
jgi:hypothetical protein